MYTKVYMACEPLARIGHYKQRSRGFRVSTDNYLQAAVVLTTHEILLVHCMSKVLLLRDSST